MKRTIEKGMLLVCIVSVVAYAAQQAAQWAVHDPSRPRPPVVRPGKTDREPPSDAVVLFDGTDLSAWQSKKDGGAAKWVVRDGYMEVSPKTGYIQTRRSFGSCQLHIEWCTPEVIKGSGQGRGNSGVFLMGKYEVQVLDSYQVAPDHYDNPTYADGQAGAIYGQKPPEFNVCRKPGRWQSYDIIFDRPKFDGDKVVRPAAMIVFQNGVLIHKNYELEGPTFAKKRSHYEPHPEELPLTLQDHGNPVRFRNIWIRPLVD